VGPGWPARRGNFISSGSVGLMTVTNEPVDLYVSTRPGRRRQLSRVVVLPPWRWVAVRQSRRDFLVLSQSRYMLALSRLSADH